MIDSDALMIGDWISLHLDTNEDVLCQVSTIYGSTIEFKNALIEDGILQGDFDSEDFFNPILLTTEILKLNGFELEPSGCVWHDSTYALDRVYVEVSFRHDGSVRRIEICNNIRTSYTSDFDCLYVHTFQHILRVCGLDELADNFKVK